MLEDKETKHFAKAKGISFEGDLHLLPPPTHTHTAARALASSSRKCSPSCLNTQPLCAACDLVLPLLLAMCLHPLQMNVNKTCCCLRQHHQTAEAAAEVVDGP